MTEKDNLVVKDNLLKDMDFWNVCGDISLKKSNKRDNIERD